MALPVSLEHAAPPVLVQAAGQPVFRGSHIGGADLRCQSCGALLGCNVLQDALFDLALKCAGGHVRELPRFPRGRGLGLVHRPVAREHQFVGTYSLDMGEIVLGERGVRQRAWETGRDYHPPPAFEFGPTGIQQTIANARATFGEVLEVVEARALGQEAVQHRLPRLIRHLEAVNRVNSNEQATEVLRWCVELQRTTNAFRRWANDPVASALIRESNSAAEFDHNRVVLEVASLFEHARLGPEFVARDNAATPDLTLRLSARHQIQVETKTPRVLQSPAERPIRIHNTPPMQTIRRALRDSRGQFTDSGILVVAGDFWLCGIGPYAEAARERLSRPLPPETTNPARQHYEQLLGVLFASLGYEIEERNVTARLYLRWVTNPRYSGPIRFTWRPDTDGRLSISFRETAERQNSRAGESEDFERTENKAAFNPARFRYDGNQVEAEGIIGNTTQQASLEPSTVWVFPDGYRPAFRTNIDLACQQGFTTVTVHQDGRFVADPSVGAIDLHNLRFTIGSTAKT